MMQVQCEFLIRAIVEVVQGRWDEQDLDDKWDRGPRKHPISRLCPIGPHQQQEPRQRRGSCQFQEWRRRELNPRPAMHPRDRLRV